MPRSLLRGQIKDNSHSRDRDDMEDATIDQQLNENTTARDRQSYSAALKPKNNLIFPELPAPLTNIYLRVRNLNSDSNCTPHTKEFGPTEDLRPRPTVEVGLKFTF